MPDWQPYGHCCHAAALAEDTAFCPECGHPFFRCVAFAQCRSLIDPLSYCQVCINPQLQVDPDAVLKAKIGEVLSIPFRLGNRSSAGRPFSILNVFKDEYETRNEPIPLNWEKIDAGQERAFSVDTRPLSHSGIHRLRLTLVLASCSGEFEEHYAFTGELAISVEGGGGPTQIVQNFDLSNSDFGTAGMVVANPNLQQRTDSRSVDAAKAQSIALERAERYELENGYRGYSGSGLRIPRDTELEFQGFPAADRPGDGPLKGGPPVVRCGRNSRRFDAERNPHPNDLCLRVYDPATGVLDVPASQGISRHLCDLMLQNNRLYLRSRGEQGMAHNGELLHEGELRVVNDGDLLAVPPGDCPAFSVGIRFKAASALVSRVILERLPRLPGCD